MLRDHIAAFALSAGLYTQVEQLMDPQIAERILPDETQTSAASSGRRPVQRADIHIVGLTGADIFLDVRVTHVSRDCLPQQHLQLTASRKAAEYAFTSVTPVIFSTDGGYDAGTFVLFNTFLLFDYASWWLTRLKWTCCRSISKSSRNSLSPSPVSWPEILQQQ
eukprot:2128997-Amphidinium_carterae.1